MKDERSLNVVRRLKPPWSKSSKHRTLLRGKLLKQQPLPASTCSFPVLPRRESRRKLDPDFFASFTDVRSTVFLDVLRALQYLQ